MKKISKTDGIRELTKEEIAVVTGGSTSQTPLSKIICAINAFYSKLDHLFQPSV